MRACGIGITVIDADKPVHHELEDTRHLIPVHRHNNHDAVRRHPAQINLIHPVLGLAEVIVRITTARPVTQRHRSRDTGFARINLPAVFGGQHAKIEKVDTYSVGGSKNFFRCFRQAKCFRHFARASLVGARRCADQQNARVRFFRIVLLLRRDDLFSRIEPLNR